MKILLICDVPFHASGLSVMAENTFNGLKALGHEVEAQDLFNELEIERRLQTEKYDVALGIGYWNDAVREIAIPKKYGVKSVVYWVSESNVPKYQDIIPECDLLVTTSEFSREVFEHYVPAVADKIKVIYPGIDTEFYRPMPDIKPSPLFTTFVSSGEVKGCEEAIAAILILSSNPPRDFKYIIHTPNIEYPLELEYYYRLKNIVKQLNLEKYITVVGGVKFPKSAMPRLYNTLYAFLAPIRMTCFSLPILEAGACGVPTLAGDWKPLNELVKDGETGLLFTHLAKGILPKFMEGVWYTEEYRFADAADMADKMRQILADEDLRNELGRKARERVLENFDSKKQIKKLEEAINNV